MKKEATDSKLHLFSHVLDLNNIPNYLQHTSDRNVIRVITKFRLSADSLNIERGIYTKLKTPRSYRICPHCILIEIKTAFSLNVKDIINPGINYMRLLRSV